MKLFRALTVALCALLGSAAAASASSSYFLSVPSTAQLAAYTSSVANNIASAVVFTSNGVEWFEYVPSSTATADGVMVIIPSDSPGTGRWLLQGISAWVPNSDSQDIAAGYQALGNFSASSLGEETAYGNRAGLGLTTGLGVTVIGKDAGWGGGAVGWTGGYSTIVGASAGAWMTGAATANTDLGDDAGEYGTTYKSSTFLGFQTGRSSTSTPFTGSFVTGVGNDALYNIAGAAQDDVAVGYNALYSLSTGQYDTAVGDQAGYSITTADYDSVFGYESGYSLSTGIFDAFFGMYSGQYVSTGAHDSCFGTSSCLGVSGAPLTGSYNTGLGDSALLAIQGAAANNTAVGFQASASLTTAQFETSIGSGAGYSDTTGGYGTYVGYQAGYSVTSGSGEVMVGLWSGQYTTTGGGETFLGFQAGQGVSGSALTGSFNTAIGNGAGEKLQGAAAYNSLVGTVAGQYVSTGAYNSALGYQALLGTSGTPLTGSYNAAFGANALQSLQGSASYNACFGGAACQNLTTGGNNTALGTQAGEYVSGGSTANATSSNSVYVGFNTEALANADTNEIVIG